MIDALARAVRVPGVVLLFALALVPAMGVPEIAGGNPVFYLAVFLLGYLLVADERFQKAVDAHRVPALVLGPLACVLVAYLNVAGWPALPAWTAAPLELYLATVLPWCCLMALLAYGRRFLRASGRFVTYASEASYPVYLLHQTVIVAVAFVVVRWDVGVAGKYAAVLALSVAVTVLVYELAVRRVGVARFLFGMKPLRREAQPVTPRSQDPAQDVPGSAPIPASRRHPASAA